LDPRPFPVIMCVIEKRRGRKRMHRRRRLTTNPIDPNARRLLSEWLLERFEQAGELSLGESKIAARVLPAEISEKIRGCIEGELSQVFRAPPGDRDFNSRISSDDDPDPGDFFYQVWKRSSPISRNPSKRRELERQIIDGIDKDLEELRMKPSRDRVRLEIIRDTFRLDEPQTKILEYVYYIRTINVLGVERLLSDADDIDTASKFTGYGMDQIFEAVRKMMHLGILGRATTFEIGELSVSIIRFLLSKKADVKITDGTIDLMEFSDTLPLNSFPVDREDIRILKSLLKSEKPIHLMLYGEPGSGKSEFVRAIILDSGRKAVTLKKSQTENKDTMVRLMAASHFAGKEYVIVIDEADGLLNTERFLEKSEDKGAINEYLDLAETSTIWISNTVNHTADSVLRRFHFSLKFEKFGVTERMNVWKYVLKSSTVRKQLTDSDVRDFSERFETNAAGVTLALSVAETCLGKRSGHREAVKKIVERTLDRHLELTDREEQERKKQAHDDLNPIGNNYSTRFLNTQPESGMVLDALQGALRSSKDNRMTSGMNLLFWGPPGVGKTEFTKFLAEKLEKKLLLKRYSDVESPYVGVTEINIARAFREAREESSILFFDEFDSFLSRRDGASRCWEVSRTNELLTWMENFRGILICATNLPDLLDPAVLRRFAWKIEFRAVKEEQRFQLFKAFFRMCGRKITAEEKGRIEALEINPGDCEAVARRFQFLPVDRKSYGDIILALAEETAWKRKTGEKRAGF